MAPLLEALPAPALVLDAACGTGRHAATLHALGHDVIGVDASPAMLDAARARGIDGLDLRLGDLTALPVADDGVDHAVCSLALTYLPDLAPPLRELARVVRPGGTILLSDIHWLSLYLGGVSGARTDDGRWALMPAHRHRPSDYVMAALDAGLEVTGCWEPVWGPVEGEGGPLAQRWAADASAAAYRDTPAAILWRLRVKPG
jgi:SAM-dependent methyltransferase